VVFVLLSVALMTLDHRQHHLGTMRASLSVIVYPLQFLVNLPGTARDWLGESFATRRTLQEENARLRTQHLVLKADLQKLAALEAENLRLRELLDSSFQVGERVLIAEIMAVDLDPYRHELLLNKGTGYGIYPGQPLVDAEGVMGQIVHVGPLTSTAMLITDPNHAIPVQVNRNGLRSIALGIGSLSALSLPHVPNNADIQMGDLLVTSGLGGHFPPGYPVAEVVEIVRNPGHAFAYIEARPLAQLNRSREVLLVWLAKQLEAQTAESIPAEDLPATGPSPSAPPTTAAASPTEAVEAQP
jgi:rod shape-determining protein MreC